MKNIISTFIIYFFSSSCLASTFIEIKFGGWSHHFKTKDEFNEVHEGIGLEFYSLDGNNNQVGVGYWRMKDSLNVSSDYFGFNYRYKVKINNNIEILPSVSFSYFEKGKKERGTITKHSGSSLIPSLSFNFYEKYGLDLFYVPEGSLSYSDTIFFRLSYRIIFL